MRMTVGDYVLEEERTALSRNCVHVQIGTVQATSQLGAARSSTLIPEVSHL
ncbi:MAG: hypothetical protein FWG59_05580 [Betaproteobacteria bacterium]|nr:hypothetical protein [Betaproteobacteria bacterium]